MNYRIPLMTVIVMLSMTAFAQVCTKYVSEDGSGRAATLERPARDLGNIAADLEPGDVVCITGGIYTGRADSGADRITVPVQIYGGYSPDFSTRSPWAQYRTIFTGVHNSQNFTTEVRLAINTAEFATRLMASRGEETAHIVVVDGIIFDNGDRNYYSDDQQVQIVRMGTPQHTPTPESGALRIRTGINSTVLVQNVIAVNTAPTQGAIALYPGASAMVTVTNNVAVNNTGAGFHLSANVAADDPAEFPTYDFNNNVSVFNQKHSAYGTFGGVGVMIESGTNVSITGSILAYNDNHGIDNAKRANDVVITGNVLFGNGAGDYLEFDTVMHVDNLEDWSLHVLEGYDNVSLPIGFSISPEWGALYSSREIIDRNAAEADVAAADSWANSVRSMLGWNLIGNDLDVDSAIWLPRMSIDDAMRAAVQVEGKYGVGAR